jgi:hypothetical protein
MRPPTINPKSHLDHRGVREDSHARFFQMSKAPFSRNGFCPGNEQVVDLAMNPPASRSTFLAVIKRAYKARGESESSRQIEKATCVLKQAA